MLTSYYIAIMLFTIAKNWKQPKYPSVDEWIKKLWYIYTMEYYAEVKNEGILNFCDRMERTGEYYAKLKISHAMKDKYHVISLNWNLMNKIN